MIVQESGGGGGGGGGRGRHILRGRVMVIVQVGAGGVGEEGREVCELMIMVGVVRQVELVEEVILIWGRQIGQRRVGRSDRVQVIVMGKVGRIGSSCWHRAHRRGRRGQDRRSGMDGGSGSQYVVVVGRVIASDWRSMQERVVMVVEEGRHVISIVVGESSFGTERIFRGFPIIVIRWGLWIVVRQRGRGDYAAHQGQEEGCGYLERN